MSTPWSRMLQFCRRPRIGCEGGLLRCVRGSELILGRGEDRMSQESVGHNGWCFDQGERQYHGPQYFATSSQFIHPKLGAGRWRACWGVSPNGAQQSMANEVLSQRCDVQREFRNHDMVIREKYSTITITFSRLTTFQALHLRKTFLGLDTIWMVYFTLTTK